MKHAVFAVATLLIILTLASISVFLVNKCVTQTISLVEKANSATQAHAARECIEAAEKYWKKHEGFFGAVLRHDEIDSVIDSFAQLKAYAVREDWDDYYGNCASLLARLEHISAKEYPLLQNVM